MSGDEQQRFDVHIGWRSGGPEQGDFRGGRTCQPKTGQGFRLFVIDTHEFREKTFNKTLELLDVEKRKREMSLDVPDIMNETRADELADEGDF